MDFLIIPTKTGTKKKKTGRKKRTTEKDRSQVWPGQNNSPVEEDRSDEEDCYPRFLTVHSTGPVADLHPSYLGVYQKIINTNRPVWKSISREDRYLLYQGMEMILSCSNIKYEI